MSLGNCYLSRIKRMVEIEEDVLTTGLPTPEVVMAKIKAGKFQTFSTGKPDYKSLSVSSTIPFDVHNFKATYQAVKITLKEAKAEQDKLRAENPVPKKR